MKLIGLTGGIACGKSAITDMLLASGEHVIDADKLVRDMYFIGKPGFKAIVKEYGMRMIEDGITVDRKKLGKLVFSDPAERAILDIIMQPIIEREFTYQVGKLAIAGADFVVYDMPLLFESGAEDKMASVICVYTTPEIQLDRLMKRNKLTEVEAMQRIDAQLPLVEKVARSDFSICNDGTLEETAQSLSTVWKEITGAKVDFA